MKRLVRAQEDILAMSKIMNKYAISDVANQIGSFVYFSESNSSHGPRIKFYGGTSETISTKKAPSLAFDAAGNCTLELADWMNKKNCPNAFDPSYISGLSMFIKRYKSILLLVWFRHLDEGDALAYFHGQITFEELLDSIDVDIPESVSSLESLDEFCQDNDLYSF